MKSSKAIVDSYLKQHDWRVKENSNSPFSFGGLNKYIGGEVSKDYWLRNVYGATERGEEIAQAYVRNYLHIHDLSALTFYCCGYSLREVLLKGVRGVPNIPTSAPARHFFSALNQIANLITIWQNEGAGAVALNSFDTLLAPFIKADQLSYKDVKQYMQNFIFSINSNSRAGAEPAFSNLTFDLTPPADIIDDYAIVGGELVSFTYRSCQREMDMINKAFFEIMLEGDAEHKLFSYPIPTYNIHERFDWDNPNNKLLWELAGKYGTPYFANFLNSDLDISDVRSMCPMTADTRLLVQALGTEAMEHMTIGELYANVGNGFFYEVWTGKRWVTATPVVTEATDIRTIKFDNGTNVKFGINHLQPTRDLGTLPASALTVGMWVPFYPEETSDQIVWRQIVSIEENTNTEPLYCLEVEDDSHIFMLANGLLTHNCRLRLDLSELRKKNGGLFGAGDSTGSVGVVTINLPRIAYEHKGDEDSFFKALAHYCDLAKDSLEIKRDWLQKNIIDTHAVPAFIEYVGTLDNHFSTIGEVGRNEACENFLGAGHGIDTPEGKEFALKIGEFIRNKLLAYQEETGHLYNYEATPAESTSYRLALGDRKDYDDIITQGSGKDCYYTNSCHIPVSKVESINETFKHQEELQAQYTGGTVIHCYLEGAVTGEQAQDIVKAMLSQYKVPYMSLSPISRYCPTHGYVSEIVDKCPICKAKLKKYQRITGYLRCVDNFNRGKAAEFKDRKQFTLSTTKLTDDTN